MEVFANSIALGFCVSDKSCGAAVYSIVLDDGYNHPSCEELTNGIMTGCKTTDRKQQLNLSE
ncbi:hypothetical protein NC651_007619 [Populus alba x Populus x berolinensis]|nr:hypothetical protein NC651_007619 [Populus alba x Populus x berolinensis]